MREAHPTLSKTPQKYNHMLKLITGASVILISVALYGVLKADFGSPRQNGTPMAAAATPAMPTSPTILVAVTPTPMPSPLLASTPEPLNIRVVEHQPDQFRKGAMSKEELSALKKAIQSIQWSRNPDPKSAANEDYRAIVKECEQSSVRDLLTDLVTEAIANDYQPNNEAANAAYSGELSGDFEKVGGNDLSNQTSLGEAAGGVTNNDRGSASSSSAWRPTLAAATPTKVGHPRHRLTVRHRIVDVKARLLALWHQSLAHSEKSDKWTPPSDSREEQTRK
jgi:hypothetical protein